MPTSDYFGRKTYFYLVCEHVWVVSGSERLEPPPLKTRA
jgi:hypothetical protein